MEPIKKILVSQSGNLFYVRNTTQDFHNQYGFVTKADLNSDKTEVESNTGHKFTMFEPGFGDNFRKMKRGPQMIPLKDIGLIISETGINKESVIVDAGAGSGGLSSFLASIAKKVTTYEIREDFLKIAEGNKELLGLKNLTIKNKDIYQGIDEKNVDVVCLDLPEPWKAVPHAKQALKTGGFLVSYSPTIPQVMDLVESIQKEGFLIWKTTEVIERVWEVEKRKVRPKSIPIGHSGFLTFARKIN